MELRARKFRVRWIVFAVLGVRNRVDHAGLKAKAVIESGSRLFRILLLVVAE